MEGLKLKLSQEYLEEIEAGFNLDIIKTLEIIINCEEIMVILKCAIHPHR